MLELRQQAEDDEALPEQVFEEEERYIDLIDTLAVNDILLKNIPELIQQALEGDEALSDELFLQVLSHVICRTLQEDWISDWFTAINSEIFDISVLNLVFYLSQGHLNLILNQAFQLGGKVKNWALLFCIRNNAWHLAKDCNINQSQPATLTEIQFLSYFCQGADKHLLQAIIDNPENSFDARFYSALGLFRFQPDKVIQYFRQKEWLSNPQTKYGYWLAFIGQEEDLRHIESVIDSLLIEHSNNDSPSLLETITAMTTSLTRWGDIETVKWVHFRYLSHSCYRVRVLGYEALLPFFGSKARSKAQAWFSERPIDSDEYGTYSVLSIQDREHLGYILETNNSSPLPKSGRYRYGKPLDKITEVVKLMEDVKYEEWERARTVRLQAMLLMGKNCAFDELAPYSVFIRQRKALREALEQYR